MAELDEEEESGKKRKRPGGGLGGGGGGSAAIMGGLFSSSRDSGNTAGILSRAVGMMAGARGGKFGGGLLTKLANALGDRAPGTVYSYPDMHHTFDYGDILAVTGDGSAWNNHTFKDAFTDALEYQDIEDHNAALNKYIRPGQTPAERQAAIKRGENEEKRLMGFWSEDRHPRRNAGAKSTAVSGVRIRNNMLWIQFGGKGKWYAYRGGATTRQAAHEAAKLLRSRSIGKAINGQWGRSHKLF